MTRFADRSLGTKLTLVIVLASAVVLLLAAGVKATSDLLALRKEAVLDLAAQAKMIGVSTRASLEFHDALTASETLSTLGERPEIVAACVYQSDGEILARYVRKDTRRFTFPRAAAADSHSITSGHVDLFHTITYEGELVGMVFLQRDLKGLYAVFTSSVLMASAALSLLLVVAYYFARRLQRVISRPILDLAEVARRVAGSKDYSVRAIRTTQDEIGQLTDAFNQMLVTIQEHESSLEEQRHQVNHELNERLRAERVLRESEERLRLAMTTARMGACECDLATGKEIWSETSRLVFGGLPGFGAGGTGRSFREMIHPEDRAADEARFSRAVDAGDPYESEFRVTWQDGTVHWVAVFGKVIGDGDPRSLRIIGVAWDISAKKLAEEEQARLEARLRQSSKMEAVGQLAGGIAHDFNNLLTVILGNASQLAASRELAAEQAAVAKEIVQAGERAANLTRQLLTFSRRRVLQQRKVDLDQIVGDMTRMLQRLIGEHIDLRTTQAEDGAWVLADAGMLEQIIVNLAINARDAMPSGGILTIATQRVTVNERQAARIPGARVGRFVRLSVADSGTGIPEEVLPHIFEPFYTTKEVGLGTGLGLATVFGIVQQHHGWIEVTTAAGRGTTFMIHLAESGAAAEHRPAEDGKGSLVAGVGTVLLVEDDRAVRSLACRVMRARGHRVIEANNAIEALSLWTVHGKEIQVVVTDMVMPGGMNGRELAERLRGEREDLRVILSSGYLAETIPGGFQEDGRLVFLEKPYSPAALLEALQRALRDNQTGTSTASR